MTTSRQPNRRVGFTLVEILVVVVLLMIVTALVVVMATETDEMKAEAAARQVAEDLEYAKSEAKKRREPITVLFFPSTNTYRLQDKAGTMLTHPTRKDDYEINLPDSLRNADISIVSASFGSGATGVTFTSPDGDAVQSGTTTPIDDPSTVVIQCNDYTYQVRMRPIMARFQVEPN